MERSCPDPALPVVVRLLTQGFDEAGSSTGDPPVRIPRLRGRVGSPVCGRTTPRRGPRARLLLRPVGGRGLALSRGDAPWRPDGLDRVGGASDRGAQPDRSVYYPVG